MTIDCEDSMSKGTLSHVLYVMISQCGNTRAIAYQNFGADKGFVAIGQVAWSPKEPEGPVIEAQVELRWSGGDRTRTVLTGSQHAQAQDMLYAWFEAMGRYEEPHPALLNLTMVRLAKMAGAALTRLNED
ncbi:hypothetical protein [Stenotrophomonas maltophilia]|uniref:hypothetical protein n=1 Tax=Stenotrophomonas maltophilia TaxID=40324 RepID=UPI00244A0AF7|nr:hypothetical protein [Stenotrophomonas maltophilia]MDH0740935.1 hypothetical protein [Stenotrophomonas maltophilia]MDH1328371.1 hypothetical protein [Stenotrophomonas maltophilia]